MVKLFIIAVIVTVLCSVSAQRGSSRSKPGNCPDTSGIITTCEVSPNWCSQDSSCPGDEKCCSYGCNNVCMKPAGQDTPVNKPKPGTCPAPSGPGLCADTCTDDKSCSGTKKCCTNGCGALACTEPRSAIIRPVKKPGSCPQLEITCIRSVCQSDADCSGNKKCCSGNCLCSSPMFNGK